MSRPHTEHCLVVVCDCLVRGGELLWAPPHLGACLLKTSCRLRATALLISMLRSYCFLLGSPGPGNTKLCDDAQFFKKKTETDHPFQFVFIATLQYSALWIILLCKLFFGSGPSIFQKHGPFCYWNCSQIKFVSSDDWSVYS